MTTTDRNKVNFQPGAARYAAMLLGALTALHCATDQPPAADGVAAVSTPILSPSNPQIAQGTAQQFTVRSVQADGRVEDVTSQVTWRIVGDHADLLPAPVAGLLQLETPGRYQLTAEYKGHHLDTLVRVTAATLTALAVSPATSQVAKGLSQQLKATATFSDGTTQDVSATSAWSIKDTVGSGVGTVSTRGLVASKQVGTARVLAHYKTLTSAATVTVTAATLQSLTVGPINPTIAKGTTQAFTAQGTFSDGTMKDLTATVDWAVTDLMGSGVAAIDELGNAVGLAEGVATVSAAYLDQLVETSLTVSPAVVTGLAISPTAVSLLKGATQQFKATATLSDGSKQDVTMMAAWTATDGMGTGVASVDGSGLAKSNTVGTSTIRCLFRAYTASAVLSVGPATLSTVTITPTSASQAKGLTQAFTLTGTYSDGSTSDLTSAAIWNAADVMGSGVATISAGRATASHEGQSRILGFYLGLTASATLTVTSAALTQIAVTPADVGLDVAATQQYAAQGIYTDGTTVDYTAVASWSVTDIAPASGVATITAGGLLTAKTKGLATVTASYSGFTGQSQLGVGIRVASVYCSTDTTAQNDVKQKLESLHSFIRVDNVDIGSAAPTLATLQKYDAVLVWADVSRGCSDSIASANVLAQYVDGGGGVVLISPYYIGNTYSNVYSSSWDKYVLIEDGSMVFTFSASLGSASGTHPVLNGITKIATNGSRCYERSAATGSAIRSGASVIATWNDGNAMVVAGSPLGKPRVDINLYAISTDIGTSGCYDSSTDVAKLLGNALLWVSGK